MADPCDLSAVEARAAIWRGALSPVELLESCIQRIEAVNPAVNAMVAMDLEAARATAKAQEAGMRAEALPPLFGLPLGVKDLIDAKGLPTTYGSPLFTSNVAAKDEAIVAMLRRSGANVLGKTNTPEWGAGGNTRNAVYGVTANPFDTTRSSAGSSGGSAVAVACGMTPIATGSDTGGSLRNPAAFNGIVGYRPSPGLIASDSRNMAWLQLPQLGPMARNVGDTCLMLSCMLDRHADDPLSVVFHGGGAPDRAAYANPPEVDLSRLRVALTPDFGFAPTERAIRAVFAEKTALFRSLFADAGEAHPDCRDADRVFQVLRGVLFLGRHRELAAQHPEKVGPNIHLQIEEGLGYSAADVADALTRQTAMHRAWQQFFTGTDILITPSITLSPRPWRELYPRQIDGVPTTTYFQWLALAYAVTNVGHPAISIPCGRDHAGLPFGLQIVGPRGGDLKVLAVARALEAYFAGNPALSRPVPDIAWLKAQDPISAQPGFRDFD